MDAVPDQFAPDRIDVSACLHPKERAWRPVAWALRLIAIPVGLLFWLLSGGPIGRRRLELTLAATGVEVTPHSAPDVWKAFTKVRQSLGGTSSIRAFIDQGSAAPASVLKAGPNSYIVLKSSLVEKLTPREMEFVMGFLVGSLHARHLEFASVDTLVRLVSRLWIIRWLYLPLLRATALTGDRIGLQACGEPQVACSALGKLLFGIAPPDEAAHQAVVMQAQPFATSPLAVWIRRNQEFPFPTERYAELARYAAQFDQPSPGRGQPPR